MSATELAWSIAGTLLGFLIGWSVGQTSTCAVTAAKEIVRFRTARLLTGFLLAGGTAGLISLPLAWALGMRAGLPPEAPFDFPLVCGAVLLALGALVNDACLFGTLGRIALGELRFLAVPVGLFCGFALANVLAPDAQQQLPNGFGRPSVAGFVLVGASTLLTVTTFLLLRRTPRPPGSWPLRWSMILLGGAGSLLFVLTPGWTYSDTVRHAALAAERGTRMAVFMPLTAAATIAGAWIAGVRSGRFRYAAPRLLPVCRSLGGGALMAVGAWFVPGGNDSLLLWAIPGGSVSALAAYTTMSSLILAIIYLRHDYVGEAASG